MPAPLATEMLPVALFPLAEQSAQENVWAQEE
jgi:hypothetical protein